WWPVIPAGILLWGLLLPGATAFWFHAGEASPKRRQRAAALSDYSLAPLAFVPLGLAMWAVAIPIMIVSEKSKGGRALIPVFGTLLIVGWFVMLMCVLAAWINTV